MDAKFTLSGFTFVRNAIKYDYPIVEAVTSILPVCDEFIINVGNSDDGTLELIKSINSDKIKIVESVWDENLRTGGRILAQQTDIALQHCTGDWCFYIQGDEVVHEKFLPVISVSLNNYNTDQRVEGLLFKYLHFYGSYKYIGTSRRWYRQEIRIIRNKKGIKSYKDAQGFRINDKKLHVKLIDAYIYHYGWVKSPEMQQQKRRYFNRLWHSESWDK
ncbi:glycosyltransferase family 2 protein, partial [candidate division KSB1 bacterium]|nr:glycosyltransferase family 2 protein [candidate division KSB1 bacterium]